MLNLAAIQSARPTAATARPPAADALAGPGADTRSQDRLIAEKILEIFGPAKVASADDPPAGNMLIARFGAQADLSQEVGMPRGAERKTAVYKDLKQTALDSQREARAQLRGLQKQGIVERVESMFLPNALVVTAAEGKHQAVADALKGMANISEVADNRLWSVASDVVDDAPDAQPVNPPDAGPDGIEWGVKRIGAHRMWKDGNFGQGVTVGIVDSGIESTHPVLREHYRGTLPNGQQQHDYNWFDPIDKSTAPFDPNGHGTHVFGSISGADADHRTGVAPGAKIIAARANHDTGHNSTVATMKALQFMLAPTDVRGFKPDPSKGADVINNSWGNVDGTDTTFAETFQGLKSAGIETVTSAGNEGPEFGTVGAPGSLPGFINVAATNYSDDVTDFSSRGPSPQDPTAMVPLIGAPGYRINSSVPGGGMGRKSGTSMAAPHVTGAVALLLSRHPQASHAQLVDALTETAVDIDAQGPDLSSGYGRIDVEKASKYLTRKGE